LKRADLVALGKVVRSQGRDGRIKLRLYERGPTGFTGRRVHIRRGDVIEAFEVESLVIDRGAPILKLKGVDTLEAADGLAGREVLAAESDFRAPEAGRFYDFQLLGSRVVTRDGAEVGTVTGLLEAGGPVLLVIRRGGREVDIPFTPAICVKVDPDAREVVIDPPDGLLDLNEI
jgi:16S rRNA processing protein RimM